MLKCVIKSEPKATDLLCCRLRNREAVFGTSGTGSSRRQGSGSEWPVEYSARKVSKNAILFRPTDQTQRCLQDCPYQRRQSLCFAIRARLFAGKDLLAQGHGPAGAPFPRRGLRGGLWNRLVC